MISFGTNNDYKILCQVNKRNETLYIIYFNAGLTERVTLIESGLKSTKTSDRFFSLNIISEYSNHFA